MGDVVYVCGTGGKTTYIRRRALEAARRGLSVLITTSTHMGREEDTYTDVEMALAAKQQGRIVMAGAIDPKCEAKIVSFPGERDAALKAAFDLVLVEADGGRHRQIKLPYSHEPVIGEDANEIVVISGARAVGMPIREAAYNAEGICALLGKGEEEPLSAEDVDFIVRKGYLEPLGALFPGIPVRHITGAARRFHFILLAAGYSRRFGSNKLLYPVEGKPMYRHTADLLVELTKERGDADLTVVTQYPEIVEALEGSGAELVINPDPLRGISSSLQCAVAHLKGQERIGGDDFLVFFPADQPFLKKDTVAAFLKGLEGSGKRLGAVTNGCEMGSPCAFASEYCGELMALRGDTGGKRVLRQHSGEIFLFSVEHQEELEDLDAL